MVAQRFKTPLQRRITAPLILWPLAFVCACIGAPTEAAAFDDLSFLVEFLEGLTGAPIEWRQ